MWSQRSQEKRFDIGVKGLQVLGAEGLGCGSVGESGPLNPTPLNSGSFGRNGEFKEDYFCNTILSSGELCGPSCLRLACIQGAISHGPKTLTPVEHVFGFEVLSRNHQQLSGCRNLEGAAVTETTCSHCVAQARTLNILNPKPCKLCTPFWISFKLGTTIPVLRVP